MKSKEKVYDYTNCSCKFYCTDCQKLVPITVITLEDKNNKLWKQHLKTEH